ncbi:hypothetical protein CAEBREN_09901 [Caenorhabditis brenneri]|uniref:Nuclear receptor domain-containing protein n=1 Tax=Caenorhabditis brenneri TaxID=135651 RepID=G0PIY9_CAEBE|nr:hypothetical protein CAEBREN_09901 [Caenorhabditis brenneri]
MLCKVCGADGSEPHFGGESCRACAAFFRRYVHSQKQNIECTCEHRLPSSHPCRHCRMLKCIATGMSKCKVQANREKNRVRFFYPGYITTISTLPNVIIPKSCDNISKTVANWVELDKKRKELHGECFFDHNLAQVTSLAKLDTKLLWNLGETIFTDVSKLSIPDRDAIISNFFPKWLVMESAIDYSMNYDQFKSFVGTDEYYKKCAYFYGTSMPEEKRIKDEDTIRIFAPFWDWHYSEVAHPVYLKKCDKVEYMALFLLLLFDNAYTNISEEGAKLCRNIRKVILRELKGYQTDQNCSEMRLAETIDTLRLLEKAEQKLQEEFVLCGLHNVVLHDDYKQIFQVKKL